MTVASAFGVNEYLLTAGPNILEGLIELDDVGVVHHFHDGNLLPTSWSPVQEQLTDPSNPNLTILQNSVTSCLKRSMFFICALEMVLTARMAWKRGSVELSIHHWDVCRILAFVEMLVALETEPYDPSPSFFLSLWIKWKHSAPISMIFDVFYGSTFH